MKKSKKSKNEENEYWLDDLLEQPENHRVEPDGSTLYGYDEEPKLFSQGWTRRMPWSMYGWLRIRSTINMIAS